MVLVLHVQGHLVLAPFVQVQLVRTLLAAQDLQEIVLLVLASLILHPPPPVVVAHLQEALLSLVAHSSIINILIKQYIHNLLPPLPLHLLQSPCPFPATEGQAR
ncbi:MAG: hypothetical protein J3R72DRAFT_452651 [Linnemannia gamsii]|nr:MAG: hypothetical protein J3R72DRAFT_452651 [Linnemannia gamsii]